jgi:UDP-arabinose 4-epimerase
MNILVTGGAGYIGSHCCKLLASQGHEVVVLDNLFRGHRRNVRWGAFEHGDLRDAGFLAGVFARHRIDAVIHFAALAYVGESMHKPGDYFAVNTTGSLNLIEAMTRAGVRDLVFSSTCATYGQPDTMPISETTVQKPVNPYGESKLMVEQLCRWYGEVAGLRWAALRYFNVAGSDPDADIGEEHEPETHLIPNVLHAIEGGPELQIFGDDYPTPDGSAIRDYIHVCDLVEAHVAALSKLQAGASGLKLNIATGTGSSVKQVLAACERVTGKPAPHRLSPRRPGDPPELVADPSRARSELGWKARYTLDDMVAHAWAYRRRTK